LAFSHIALHPLLILNIVAVGVLFSAKGVFSIEESIEESEKASGRRRR